MVNLARLGQLLEATRSSSIDALPIREIEMAQIAAQRDTLSLPSCKDIRQGGQDDLVANSATSIYELCRKTAILYSTAVLFALPPDNGWHLALMADIRTVLDDILQLPKQDESFLVIIWSLVICGCTSQGTGHRSWYECTLRGLLLLKGYRSLDQVLRVVREFLWSDEACSESAATLWSALDIK
jgi:hypothetical protein